MKVLVIGEGVTGSNAVNRMIGKVKGVRFFEADTDEITQELVWEIGQMNLVFVISRMGGKGGIGIAPHIAWVARQRHVFTVGIVADTALDIEKLEKQVNALFVIPEEGQDEALERIIREVRARADVDGLAKMDLSDLVS